MKKFIGFLVMAILLMLVDVPGQTAVSDSTGMVSSGSLYVYKSYTAGTLKGTDSVKSVSWGRGDFDSTYSFFGLFSSATDSAKVTVKLQCSPNGTNWKDLRTCVSAADTTTMYYYEDAFSEVAPYFRLLITGVTGNGYTTTFKVWLYAKRE